MTPDPESNPIRAFKTFEYWMAFPAASSLPARASRSSADKSGWASVACGLLRSTNPPAIKLANIMHIANASKRTINRSIATIDPGNNQTSTGS
jgi:hypothetical protein